MKSVAVVHDPSGGHLVVRIRESDTLSWEMRLADIAAWGELLGVDDPVEVLQLAIQTQKEMSIPPHDPETGRNVWTDAYTLLTYREQVREEEAMRAIEKPDKSVDFRSPELRAHLAAHNAVHLPIDGGECAMDRCRREARETLGLPDPKGPRVGASSRLGTVGLPSHSGESQNEALAHALLPHVETIGQCRREFLHGVGGLGTNPLGDTGQAGAEAGRRMLTAQELLDHYQEAA